MMKIYCAYCDKPVLLAVAHAVGRHEHVELYNEDKTPHIDTPREEEPIPEEPHYYWKNV